jgi:hypothetical protein
LELLQVDERDGQACEVGHVVVEQLGRLVHAVVEAAVANLANIRVVRTLNAKIMKKWMKTLSSAIFLPMIYGISSLMTIPSNH